MWNMIFPCLLPSLSLIYPCPCWSFACLFQTHPLKWFVLVFLRCQIPKPLSMHLCEMRWYLPGQPTNQAASWLQNLRPLRPLKRGKANLRLGGCCPMWGSNTPMGLLLLWLEVGGALAAKRAFDWILTEIMMKSKYVDMLEEAGRCVQRIGLCKCGQCPCLASPQGLHCLKPPSHFHYTCNNKNGNQFMSPTMTLTLQYWLLNCDNKMFSPALQFALRDENGWSLIKSKHIRCPVFASIVFF